MTQFVAPDAGGSGGKNFCDLGYPEDLAAKLQRQIGRVFDTRQGLTDETPNTSPTGVRGYYEYRFRPVFGVKGAVEAVAARSAITKRRRAEQVLRTGEPAHSRHISVH